MEDVWRNGEWDAERESERDSESERERGLGKPVRRATMLARKGR